MKEFAFTVGGEPGSLFKVVDALGQAHVNIDGIAGIAQADSGVIRLVTDNPSKARDILRSLALAFDEAEAILIDLPNHPANTRNDLLYRTSKNCAIVMHRVSRKR